MKEKNPLLTLLVGIVMLGVGLFWLFNSVEVSAIGWGSSVIRIGSISFPSGLTVVPLIVGIFWMVVSPKSIMAKILSVLGVVFIVASIIMSVKLRFESKSLYEYILMLVFIVVGAGLTARVLLTGNKSDDE